MPELSRAQLFVYAAMAVACLLLGARWIKSDAGAAAPASHGSGEPAKTPGGSVKVETAGKGLVVHVAGEVARPGVYRLPFGARVADAIERAGGTTRRGQPDAINLAAPLADGQQVQVPARTPPGQPTATSTGAAPGPISLGSATAAELETIEGIGPVTAAAILAFRDENGGIGSIDDLDQVSGIGPATLEALRAKLQP